MPAMIGGFLRRGRVYGILFSLIVFADLVKWFNSQQQGLSTGAYSNEGMSEGCVIRGNRANISDGPLSTLILIPAVLLSLTKVNHYFKNGSAIIWGVTRINSEGLTMKGVNEAVLPLIRIGTNSITDENLTATQDSRIYWNSETISIKRGNLGKEIQLKLMEWINIPLGDSRDTGVNLLDSRDKFILVFFLLNVTDLVGTSCNRQESICQYGGKISEEANVRGNARNTIPGRSLFSGHRPTTTLVGQKLNSLCLRSASTNATSSKSVQDQTTLFVRQRLDESSNKKPRWNIAGEMKEISEKVFAEQAELVKLAQKHGLRSEKVFKQQLILMRSLNFRTKAIDSLSNTPGSKTAGIDNVSLADPKTTQEILRNLLAALREYAYHPNKYWASPVKRVCIPKYNGKLRPLGIPTLLDRALQHLVKLVLEPLVEITSEQHSYGFRPYRSAKQAIAHLRVNLKTLELDRAQIFSANRKKNEVGGELLPENKWIFDADIKGFFDHISHSWLLENLFLHRDILKFVKAWLESGSLDKGEFTESEQGTPQGGVISPILANFTLNGLEKAIMDSINPLTKSKERRLVVTPPDGTKTRFASALAYARYADDFVVLARSSYLIEKFLQPAIVDFLATRGLSLSKEKTKVFRLVDEGAQLDFLGYTFKYQAKWRHNRHIFYTHHSGGRGIALYPNRMKVLSFIEKLKAVFLASKNLSAYELIAKLNPMITGWSYYFNLGNSSHYRSLVRNALYHMIWKWAHRKHPRWGKKLIARIYFLRSQEKITRKTNTRNVDYSTFKATRWVFSGIVWAESRYNPDSTKRIFMVDPSNISQVLSTKEYCIPKPLIDIHAFAEDYMKLVTWCINVNIKALGINNTRKQRLLKQQNGLCAVCGKVLEESNFLKSQLHIHHINPIFRGGSAADVKNMILLHAWCHRDLDHGLRAFNAERHGISTPSRKKDHKVGQTDNGLN